MSTTVIPAKSVTHCDCCGAECTAANWRERGKLHLERAALDMQGHAVASNDIRLDLCDTCQHAISAVINATAESIRRRSAQKEDRQA